MNKPSSPLINNEYLKIDDFFIKNKNVLGMPKDYSNLDSFIQKNFIFKDFISDLNKADKVKAWMYLHKLVKGDILPKKEVEQFSFKKWHVGVLVVILAVVFMGLSKYLTDKPKSVENTDTELNNNEPKIISKHAFNEYTRENFSKLYQVWEEDWIPKLEKMERDAANKIANEKNTCDFIDMVALSEIRSTPKKEMVMFVDCGNGERFYVSDKDIKSNTTLISQTQKSVSHDYAINQCKEMISANTIYQNPVNYKLLDTGVRTAELNGNVVVMIGFNAKNSLGLDQSFKARCIFPPDQQPEITIS